MPSFDPEVLAAWTAGRWTARPAVPPAGFTIDSRRVLPGQVFVALKTPRRDGRDFLADARAAGASAAIVGAADRSVALPQLVVADSLAALQTIAREHRRRFAGPVIGVTGSAGKTSTKELLAVLLGGEPEVLSTEANLNNHLGVPLTLSRLDPQVHRFAVVEAGISAPGEMEPLAAMISPDLAIVTLVGPAHLAELGSVEAVAREKARLAAAVGPGGLAIFPASCAAFAAFRELKVPVLVVGRADGAPPAGQVAPLTIRHDPGATTIALSGEVLCGLPGVGAALRRVPASADLGGLSFQMVRVSDGMAGNAALALCAALALGMSPADLRARIGRWRPAALRGEVRLADGKWLYMDCYNANPASMADALAAFAAAAPAGLPRIYVLGSMEELGSDCDRFHRDLGAALRLGPQDEVFALGAGAPALRRGALEAGAASAQVRVVDSLDPVEARLEGFRGAVFVKGSRRHALERLVGEAAHV